MSTRGFFLARWEDEVPTFLKVFRALGDQHGFRPHPRSRSAAELVWSLVLEVQALVTWAGGKDVEWKVTPPPRSMDEIIAAYEKARSELGPRLKALDDAAWEKPVKLIVNTGGAYEFPLGEMFWFTLFDAIHHRGQLSLYIRLSGGKVPGIYGPSADEKAG